MAYVDIQRDIEKRIGAVAGSITLSNLVDDEIKTIIAQGYTTVIRRLMQYGNVGELRHFMKTSTATHVVVAPVTCTNNDPSVFTKVAHGLSNGDEVELNAFIQATELNGMKGLIVENKTDNTFEIKGISADPAETTGGRVTKVNGTKNYTSNDVTLEDADSLDGDLFMVRRYSNTHSRFFNCAEVSLAQDGDASDIYSPLFATKQNPVYMMVNKNTIRVKPAPTALDYLSFSYIPIHPSDFDEDTVIFDNSDTDNMPESFYLPIMFYSVAEVAMMQYALEVREIVSSSSDWISVDLPSPLGSSPPNTVTAPIINPVVYGEYDLPTAPVYIAPVTPTGPSDGDFDSITSPVFSIEDSTLNAFITDDDYEMSSVTVQKLSTEIQAYGQDISKFGQEISKYSQDISEYSQRVTKYGQDVGKYAQEVQSSVQKYSSEVTEYNAIIAKRVAAAEGHMAAEINAIQQDLVLYQHKLTDYGVKVQSYSAEIQDYSARVQQYSYTINENIQKESTKIARKTASMQSLLTIRTDYLQRFEEFMRVRSPEPQQKQQQREGA